VRSAEPRANVKKAQEFIKTLRRRGVKADDSQMKLAKDERRNIQNHELNPIVWEHNKKVAQLYETITQLNAQLNAWYKKADQGGQKHSAPEPAGGKTDGVPTAMVAKKKDESAKKKKQVDLSKSARKLENEKKQMKNKPNGRELCCNDCNITMSRGGLQDACTCQI
jgi:hypothetical protein